MRAASSRPMPPWTAPTTNVRRSKLCASWLGVNFCFTASVYPPHAHKAQAGEHRDDARDDGEQDDREQYLRGDGHQLYGRELGTRNQRRGHDVGHDDSCRGQPVEPEIAPGEAELDQLDDDQREREQEDAAAHRLTRIEVV